MRLGDGQAYTPVARCCLQAGSMPWTEGAVPTACSPASAAPDRQAGDEVEVALPRGAAHAAGCKGMEGQQGVV